jgi:SAF domain
LSVGRIVMILAALAAFALNVHLLRSNDDVRLVAVTERPVEAGTVITGDLLGFVEVEAPDPVVSRLVTDTDQAVGLVASVDIPQGEPIARSLLRDAAADQELRAFTIAVDPAHAGGGSLISPGDAIDVVAVEGGVARYVVTGASVIDVAETGDRGLVAASDYYVVVAVDADTALALAEALQADSIEVVRATGAPSPDRLTLTAASEDTQPADVEAGVGR